jgi:hypothetical protein
MANKFTDAVFNIQLPGESRNRVVLKAILMAVAWRTDNKSGLCWPSYARIAHDANCSRQAVKENLPALIELGLLTVAGKKITKNGPIHILRVNMDAILKFTDQGVELPGSPATGVSESGHQGVERDHQGVERRHQGARHTKNSSLNSSENSSLELISQSYDDDQTGIQEQEQDQDQHQVLIDGEDEFEPVELEPEEEEPLELEPDEYYEPPVDSRDSDPGPADDSASPHTWVPSRLGPRCAHCGIYKDENGYDPQPCVTAEGATV